MRHVFPLRHDEALATGRTQAPQAKGEACRLCGSGWPETSHFVSRVLFIFCGVSFLKNEEDVVLHHVCNRRVRNTFQNFSISVLPYIYTRGFNPGSAHWPSIRKLCVAVTVRLLLDLHVAGQQTGK